MYEIKTTTRFKKDIKALVKQGKNMEKLWKVVELLAAGEELPTKNKLHNLSGDYSGFGECHIEPDWLLIFLIDEDVLVLTLTRTGSHSDLF